MFDEVEKFVGYLRDVKKMSQNTILSYRRDLLQFASYMADRGVAEAGKVTKIFLRIGKCISDFGFFINSREPTEIQRYLHHVLSE